MYARDYHPDENMVFKTKNYGFTSPKSTPLDPVGNMAVQIDNALKLEEVARTDEDLRLGGLISAETANRINADKAIDSRISSAAVFGLTVVGDKGGCYGVSCSWLRIDNIVTLTCVGNMYGTFQLMFSDFLGAEYRLVNGYGTSGAVLDVIPDYHTSGQFPRLAAIGNDNKLTILTGMPNTTDSSDAISLSFTVTIALKTQS